MSSVKEAASAFLANKRIAVTGVSRTDNGHGSNLVYRRLRERGGLLRDDPRDVPRHRGGAHLAGEPAEPFGGRTPPAGDVTVPAPATDRPADVFRAS